MCQSQSNNIATAAGMNGIGANVNKPRKQKNQVKNMKLKNKLLDRSNKRQRNNKIKKKCQELVEKEQEELG
jgi:hypothetical protein